MEESDVVVDEIKEVVVVVILVVEDSVPVVDVTRGEVVEGIGKAVVMVDSSSFIARDFRFEKSPFM